MPPDRFSIFDQLTEARSAMEIEQAEAEQVARLHGEDPARAKRDAERRERLGQLRAREHSGKRPNHVRSAFGPVNMY
jgi:hypothetical protein